MKYNSSYIQESSSADLRNKGLQHSKNIVDINILLNRVRTIEKNKKNKKIILLSLSSFIVIFSGLYFSF